MKSISGAPPKRAGSRSRPFRQASSSLRKRSASCWCAAARGFSASPIEGERVLEWARRIVSDARGLRQDVEALKRGLTGHLRIAAIPTALPMVASLTTPFQARHPEVRYTVLSRTSEEILELLANLNIDAGLTYIDNEPLGNVTKIALYKERYCLVTEKTNPFAKRTSVTWAEAATVPLCLLTRDMQNRRIIDRALQKAYADATVMLEEQFDDRAVLAHPVRALVEHHAGEAHRRLFGLSQDIKTIPIVDEHEVYTVGLVAGPREPLTPLVSALMLEAKQRRFDPLFTGR